MKVSEMCPVTLRHLARDLDRQAKDADLEVAAQEQNGNRARATYWEGISARATSNAQDYRRKALKAEKARKKETVDAKS